MEAVCYTCAHDFRQETVVAYASNLGKNIVNMGGSPGLVVMGGVSYSEGCGFESQHHILAGQVDIRSTEWRIDRKKNDN